MATQLIELPGEVLERVFWGLKVSDRLILSRTCSALKLLYDESANLQYATQLATSAYLDVQNQPPAIKSSDDVETEPPVADPTTNSFISPHTGRLRPSIESVKLAPFPEDPSPRPATVYISPAEKMKLLKEREDNWDTLTPKKIRRFNISGHAGIYELQEGVFLMCDNYAQIHDAALVRSRPFSVRLIPLPSSVDPDLEEPITHTKSVKVDFPISDLTIDPTQDLIVASEFIGGGPVTHMPDPNRRAATHRYHLLTLSTLEPHPLAALTELDFPPTNHMILQTRQLLQIMGDTLVILVSRFAAHWLLAGFGGLGTGNDEEIVCWNWKTGRVLARMSLPENGWFSSLALLSPTTFMITSTTDISPVLSTEPRAVASAFPPVIKIYSFAPDPERDIVPVQPLDLEHNDDTTPRPVLVAQLHIPPVAEGAVMGSFEVRPDPAFPPSPVGDQPMLGSRKPFTQDPAKGVLVFEIQLGDPPPPGVGPDDPANTTTSFELFVLREYLNELASEGQERLRRSRLKAEDENRLEIWDVLKSFAWSEWGTKHARLLTQSMATRLWVCSCSGYRYVSLIEPYDAHLRRPADPLEHPEPEPQDLLLFDFSPYSVRRQKSRAIPATSDIDIVDMSLDDPEDDEWTDFSHDPLEIDVIDDMSCIEMGHCWKEDVWTGLPYVRIRKEMGVVASGVMMDDQRVMMVLTEDDDRGRTRQEFTVLCM